jgi:hypothetical protein
MNQALTIAHKEILDGLRDVRSIVASLVLRSDGSVRRRACLDGDAG